MTEDGLAIFSFGVVAFFIGLLIGGGVTENRLHDAALKRGHAVYCPHNGEFAWIGECDQ